MAYTIISQNNNTTTLSDGVNTITVPSRVNLTSGNFTIVEVNNNMATLEDGDGNVYRDIPCVVNLVDAGGGSSLPDQTGQSGKFLTTDGTDASWSDKPLVNTATGTSSLTILGTGTATNYSVNVGESSKSSQVGSVVIGRNAETRTNGYNTKQGVAIGLNAFVEGNGGIAIGTDACSYTKNMDKMGEAVAIGHSATAYDYGIAIGHRTQVFNNATGAIQLGNSLATGNTVPTQNMDAHTFKVGLRTGTNYELLSSDGTIPTARLTKVNTTVTIAVADWNGGTTVTKTVTGMTATGVVLVSPDPTDQSAYTSAGIICTTQAADSLTFTCSTTPTADIDVVVVML